MAKGKLIAEGTYQHSTGEAITGRETWQISQLGHGGIIVTSRGEFSSPPGHNWSLTYELDRAWSPVSLSIRLQDEGHAISTTQRAEADRWIAQVENADGSKSYELPFSPKHEVDFASPLFNTVTLLRSRLPVGQTGELDVIFLQPDTLLPVQEKQRYECLSEDKVQVPAGGFPAIKYRMTHPGKEGAPTNDIWADRHGIVLLYESGPDQMKLIRYLRTERR